MVMTASAMLLNGFGSGLDDTAPPSTWALPVRVALTVMVSCTETPAASEDCRQATRLPCFAQPVLHEVSAREAGKATAAITFCAAAGPLLVKVSVHVPVAPTARVAGQDSPAARSAFVEAGVTVTVNGPAVAVPAPLVAVTE